MIRLRHIAKTYPTRRGQHRVLHDVNLDVARGEKVGILGRNGAGKSTLIRLISGADLPTSGSIERGMSVSWPLAFGGAFQGTLSGLDNLKFICRIYGIGYQDRVEFVQDFSELGHFLREPVKSYSSGMRSRLAFAISMAIEFDCYLIDELVAVGDARFQRKCQEALFEHRAHRAFLMASHDTHLIANYCDRALIIEGGQAKVFDDIDEAVEVYTWLRAA